MTQLSLSITITRALFAIGQAIFYICLKACAMFAIRQILGFPDRPDCATVAVAVACFPAIP
jgi:hypothetical protein